MDFGNKLRHGYFGNNVFVGDVLFEEEQAANQSDGKFVEIEVGFHLQNDGFDNFFELLYHLRNTYSE